MTDEDRDLIAEATALAWEITGEAGTPRSDKAAAALLKQDAEGYARGRAEGLVAAKGEVEKMAASYRRQGLDDMETACEWAIAALDRLRAEEPKPTAEAKAEVYSRPECVFHYCPYPDVCSPAGGCQHKRG